MLADFHDRYWADQEAGKNYPVEHYLELFANHRRVVLQEYESLQTRRALDDSEPTTVVGHSNQQEKVAHYRLLEVLGRGGQAVVWLAEDERLGRRVALKLFRGSGEDGSRMLARFRREAALTAKIDHPLICPMHDVGLDGVPWIAMRYVPGPTLSDVLRDARRQEDSETASSLQLSGSEEQGRRAEEAQADHFDSEDAADRSGSMKTDTTHRLRLVEKIARALHVAHEVGIVHRDIKPSNIKINSEGDPVVLDFGIAFMEESDQPTLTETGDFVGTPAYMAPEQFSGSRARIDRRADIYSLGVLLFECLTLRRPFEQPTRELLYHAILSEEAPALRKYRPSLSSDLEVVVATALQKKPDDRYRDAASLADEIRRVIERKPIQARPAGLTTRTRRWIQRNPVITTAFGLCSALLITALVTTMSALQAEKRRAEAEGGRLEALERESVLHETEARLQAERRTFLEDAARAAKRSAQLSDIAILEHLIERADELWPPREELLPKMDQWLSEADEVASRFDQRKIELDQLRAIALPLSTADEAEDLRLRRLKYPDHYLAVDAAEQAMSAWRADISRAELPAPEIEKLKSWLAGTETNLKDFMSSEAVFQERLLYRFVDQENERLHQALSDFAEKRPEFEKAVSAVKKRRLTAIKIKGATIDASKADWDRCIEDMKTSYPGLIMKPQVGLIPLGRDGQSGLWEFLALDSGEKPGWKGPELGGQAIPSERTGVVLVLLPGAKVNVGAQREVQRAANFDTLARRDEWPVTEVSLEPFFISKYEMTQAQWAFIWREAPSRYAYTSRLKPEVEYPDLTEEEKAKGIAPVTMQHPVESVTWEEASETAHRLDLRLPTEEQWEYAARAGTTTPWWTGADRNSLKNRVNLSDTELDRTTEYDLSDGCIIHAPVGNFPANAFGLHEMLGNVSEWTASTWGDYVMPPRRGDGYRIVEKGQQFSSDRVHRGGSFMDSEAECRAAGRGRARPKQRASTIGLRLSRDLRD